MAEHDDPQELLKIGTKMIDGLVTIIAQGYATDENYEDHMIMEIFDGLLNEPPRQTAAMAMAALFKLAKATEWDLVLAGHDGTRVVIPCDTKEEQTARALEIMREAPGLK